MEFRIPCSFGLIATVISVFVFSLTLAVPVGAKTVIKLGSPTIKESVHHWMLEFEKRAGDRFDAKVFPLSQLGTIPRMLKGDQLGTIEMVMIPPAFMVGIDQLFQVLTAPGVFKDQAHGYRTAHDPEFMKAYWPLGEPKGIKMVAMFCPSDTSYVSRTPIRKLVDFGGKKIRVFASGKEREVMRRLGAAASPMPLSEVLPAIQRGVLDGAKSGIVILWPSSFST